MPTTSQATQANVPIEISTASMIDSQPQAAVESNAEKIIRLKRELVLKTVMAKELSSAASEDENLAIEEGYQPDGIADHHQVLNQTTLNDRSNSEFWSSFSSSEEALLNCAGMAVHYFIMFPLPKLISASLCYEQV